MAVRRRDPSTGLPLPGTPPDQPDTPASATGIQQQVTRPQAAPRAGAPTRRKESVPDTIQQPGTGRQEGPTPAPVPLSATATAQTTAQPTAQTTAQPSPTPPMTAPPLSGNVVAQLRAQATPTQQFTTPEGQGAAELVTNTFSTLMGRAPNPQELQAWTVGLLFGDRTVADMVDQIMSFPEAQARLTEPSAGTPGVDVPFQLPQNVWNALVQGIVTPAQVEAPTPSELETQLSNTLAQLLEGGGQVSDAEMSRLLTSAREPLDILSRAQQEQAMADLAARGTLEGGLDERAILEINEALAPAFAAGGRDIAQMLSDRQLQQFTTAVQQAGQLAQTQQQTGSQQAIAQAQLQQQQAQLALQTIMQLTGANQDQANLLLQSIQSAANIGNQEARFLLDVINSMVNFQGQTTQLALNALAQNTAWNQFLSGMGLDRAQFMRDAQQGNLSAWQGVLNQFAQLLSQSQLGFAGGTQQVPQ